MIGRQPILDKQQQLIGYELLYRGDQSNTEALVKDGDAATTSVLCNALLEIGLDQVVGNNFAFVNFTKSFLQGTSPIPLECERIVVEVLENVKIDSKIVDGVQQLSDLGYRIALDDFIYSPQWDPLLEIADIVKLDVLEMTDREVADHALLLKEYEVNLLAEKVETHEEFAMCSELGFDYFQGYFFAKPNVLQERSSHTSRGALLSTLAVVNNPDAGPDEIEAAVSQDVSLVHKLLRYVNSSAFGLRSKVETIRQSIVYLGKEKVSSIVSLLLLTSFDDKPPTLAQNALIRALACQNIALALGVDKQDSYFAVGLLSILDALLDRPIDEIVNELPVTPAFRQALIDQEGPMGACLNAVTTMERVDDLLTESLPLPAAEQHRAYLHAVSSVESRQGMASMLPATSVKTQDDDLRRKSCQMVS